VIVVTAAGGRTGTAVVRELRARGEAVRAVVARRGARPELAGLRAEEALDVSGVTGRVLQPCAYADNFDDLLPEVAARGVLRGQWGLRRGQSLLGRPPRTFAEHLADLPGRPA
jgi:nucleoside-diphosphate-sugar epimerase